MSSDRYLFGGAISCEVPSSWRDVSDIRQVPDNQEVWQELDGHILVVEILEHQADVENANAALFFFDNLAHDNGIVSPNDKRLDESRSTLQSLPRSTLSSTETTVVPNILQRSPPNAMKTGVPICVGTGVQKVAMGRETDMAGNRRDQEVTWIYVELCVIRLANQSTDLLVTLSKPVPSLEKPPLREGLTNIFSDILQTLTIQDWELFG